MCVVPANINKSGIKLVKTLVYVETQGRHACLT